MKEGVIGKPSYIVIIVNYFLLPVVGWFIGKMPIAIVGLVLAYLFDVFFPRFKYELTWSDINLALVNIYKYGKNPCELCFYVKSKRIYIYRDERGNIQEPIQMSVRIPVIEWKECFDNEDFHQLLKIFGGAGFYCGNREIYFYGIFPRDGMEGCKEILKFLFEKSVGGIRPFICAQKSVNSRKNIWVEHEYDEIFEKKEKARFEKAQLQQQKIKCKKMKKEISKEASNKASQR